MTHVFTVVQWLLAPFVDKWEGLSLTRLLAVGVFALAWFATMKGMPLPAAVVSLCFLAVATATPGD